MKRTLLFLLVGLIGLVLGVAGGSAETTSASDTAQNTPLFLPAVRNPQPFDIDQTVGTFYDISDIAHAGDDRLFVTNKDGLIWVMQSDGSVSLFLDLTSRVDSTEWEWGLFSIAFAHDYATSGHFYVAFTGIPQGEDGIHLIVSRFTVGADPNVANPNSETVLFALEQTTRFHQGGDIAIHPINHRLYIATGDDNQANRAALDDNFYGKVLSLNVNAASVPPPTIAALGMRNPWRIAFDERTGALFISDVGVDSFEEVNYLPHDGQPRHFGWPCYEGTIIHNPDRCDEATTYTPPAYSYAHTNERCSITGGDVVHDATSPYNGGYMFGDFCSAELFIMRPNGAAWEVELLGTASRTLLSTFGRDHAGNLYGGFITFQTPVALDKYILPR